MAYNVQLATDVDSRVIVGLTVTNRGSDRAAVTPMLDQLVDRTGRQPAAHLVDGGFFTRQMVTDATARGVTVYAPLPQRRDGQDPTTTPVDGESRALAAWRTRMTTAEGKQIYKHRAATAEWVNADGRAHRTLDRIPVRGLAKVHTWALWIALAHNMMRTMEIVPHLMT